MYIYIYVYICLFFTTFYEVFLTSLTFHEVRSLWYSVLKITRRARSRAGPGRPAGSLGPGVGRAARSEELELGRPAGPEPTAPLGGQRRQAARRRARPPGHFIPDHAQTPRGQCYQPVHISENNGRYAPRSVSRTGYYR